ncbi:SRPBCC family protein [Halobacillus shinanisalinarum]|uniref:SRPBCC family protein n=1 Tax=Halobacillus shinanisalinarum TaxID=2932258 RepID=A0ABY4GW13_9BACI|nr:SRPBCC family protein [Halobacillus shinanisalinarum]UOQ92176.1 SRPBCC family protein [Halobacillus shinanisalinarum]
MKIYVMKTRQQLPITVDRAWTFFSNAGNLSDITPPWMKFEVTGELPEQMYPGMIATYRLQPLLGVSLNWVTEITHMVEGKYFVDEQRFGPYRFWHHQHHFKQLEHGMEMIDIVHYALPFATVGRIVHKASVEKKLAEIFRYRRKKLDKLFK